ncbi:MAG: UbiD family decarboxylase, partial [Deltaproteobacteria bacterium]|nr:UbiD family decarboxylase [Deltaproteobacteria bacterium]
EIVIEGRLSTEFVEPEGPFGESHGYMHPRMLSPYLEISCITRKRNPILVSWTSQVTPSESSIIKRVGYEPLFLSFLKKDLGIKSVLKVAMHEPLTNLRNVVVIQMKKPAEAESWRALTAAAAFHPGVGKFLVAVDEDIDPWDMDMVMWAITFRSTPHRDVQILKGRERWHGPPFTHQRDPAPAFPAGLSAEAGVHGTSEGYLGGAGPGAALPQTAVVRLLPGRLGRGARGGGQARGSGKISAQRRKVEGAPGQGISRTFSKEGSA